MSKISFLFSLCIALRFSIAFAVYKLYNNKYSKYLSIILLIIGLGFVYQYMSKVRKVGAFGQKIWWDNYRPIHAILYVLGSVLLYMKNKYAFMPILLDTIIGIIVYLKKN